MSNKEIKMQLLKEFGISDDKKTVDFCREAYKFLIEDDPVASVQAPVISSPAEVIAVDLGLPSGKLWADRNVGAKSPEDYGAFFSWGNVEPHFPNKDNMDWGDDDEAFDYKFSSEEYKKTPGYKLEGNIDAEHDAATVNLGEPWCMPTEDDFQELYDNCDWTRKTVNGVNGYLVTSKINGNSIFFPCSWARLWRVVEQPWRQWLLLVCIVLLGSLRSVLELRQWRCQPAEQQRPVRRLRGASGSDFFQPNQITSPQTLPQAAPPERHKAES